MKILGIPIETMPGFHAAVNYK